MRALTIFRAAGFSPRGRAVSPARGLAIALGWALPTLPIAWPILPIAPRAFAQDANDPLPTELTGPISDEELHLPVDARLGERIDEMIARLGSPVFKEREVAVQALIEIGAPAFAKLRTTYHEVETLDVRLAIEEIVQTGYLNYHVYDRQGFLGVSLSPYMPDMRVKPALPADTKGVIVMEVVPGTGAVRAGLATLDVIVAVDQAPLTSPPHRIVSDLAASIRARRPGTPMILTVVRGPQTLSLEAVVGRCPPEQVRIGRVAAIPELLHRASERFPIWWDRYFKPSAAAPPKDGGA